eukprot:UN07070
MFFNINSITFALNIHCVPSLSLMKSFRIIEKKKKKIGVLLRDPSKSFKNDW